MVSRTNVQNFSLKRNFLRYFESKQGGNNGTIIESKQERCMSKKQRSAARPAGGKAGANYSGKTAVDKSSAIKPTSHNYLLIGGGIALVVLMALAVIFLRPGATSTGDPSASSGASIPAAAQPSETTVEQGRQKYDSGVFLLDVRLQEEWNEAHIPNTTLIPLNELKDRLSELPKDQEILVICRSGNRSKQGRDILLNAGFSSVTSMAGGLNQWKAAGYPTVSGP
jgi:rhodanese-related sulfurtransferase